MDRDEKKLKIYEVWQQIIIQAMKEFYLLDAMLLVIFSGIFKFADENPYLPCIGLFGAIIWYFANLTQLMWKRNWTGRAQNLEETIIDKNEFFAKDEKQDPKFFCIPLHLTFFLSFIPIIFVFLFGIELELFNSIWVSHLVLPLYGYIDGCKEIVFLTLIVILIIKLFHASFCYCPYPLGNNKKRPWFCNFYFKIMKTKCCPKWFRPVACVIIYNSEKRILLGKRKKGSDEGGKWGLLGGTGAFVESSNPKDFAKREMEYDIKHKVDFNNLKHFENIIKFTQKSFTLEMYFYYSDEEINTNKEIKTTKKLEAPEEVRWCSKDWVENNKEKVAFNNGEVLEKFYNEILSKL